MQPSIPAATPPRGRSVTRGGGDRWGAVATAQKGGAAAAARMRGTQLAGRGGDAPLGVGQRGGSCGPQRGAGLRRSARP